jgi:hypothetical protein
MKVLMLNGSPRREGNTAAALKEMGGGDLGGADTGKSAPGRDFLQKLHRCQVIAALEGSAAQAHRFPVSCQPLGGTDGFSLQGNFRGGGEPLCPPVKGGNGFAFRICGKQRQLELLHGITVVMADECQIHMYLSIKADAVSDKDYTAFPWPR